MLILGVDPGSLRLGWGIVALGSSRQNMQHVASGTLRAPAAPLLQRLLYLTQQITLLLQQHRPQVAAMEEVFCAKNVRSALVLAQARGAILVTLAQAGLPVHEYSATHVKQAVSGAGHTAKRGVQHMVQCILQLPPPSVPGAWDTSDALAVALCHAQAQPRRGQLSWPTTA